MSDITDGGLQRVPSGVAGIDTILGGGFLRGGLYIVQGMPGTGKTTLANQISFNHIARGGRALYVTLLSEYHSRMMQHLRGMSFFDPAQIPDRISYVSGFRTFRNDGLRGLLDLIRREVIANGVSLLVIDGLVASERAASDARALSEFVHELQGVALATDCTMFMVTGVGAGERVTPEHTMVDGILGLFDQQFGWSAERTLELMKFRGSAHLRGKHAFEIGDGGLMIYPRIEALLAQPSRPDLGSFARASSGIDRLDTMLGGGLPTASTTMIMGPSGVGKTTLGLHFLSRSSDAEPGLMLGFYETSPRILAKSREVCGPLVELLEGGAVEVLWQPPTDGMLDAYGARLLEAVHRRGVKRLFIDGLGAFQTAANDSNRMSHYLTAMMNELRVLGVTTVCTLEVPDIIGPHIRTPIGDLSSLAENLVLLRYIELRSRLYRLISILKVRDSDFDPLLHQFALTNQGLAIEATNAGAEAILTSLSNTHPGELSPGQIPQPGPSG